MFIVMIFSIIVFSLTMIMMLIALILSNKSFFNREKASPFECGFDSNLTNRLPFSLRFFLITIIFLIFDVEVVVLLPSLKSFLVVETQTWWLVFTCFISILILGLFHEWNQGALKWSL